MAFASWEWHLHSPQPQPRCLPRGLLLPQIVLPPCLAGCSGCCWGPWRFLRVRGALPCSPPPLLPAPCSGMRRCRAERRPPVLGAVSFRQQGQGQRARVGREPLGRDGAGGGAQKGRKETGAQRMGGAGAERSLQAACSGRHQWRPCSFYPGRAPLLGSLAAAWGGSGGPEAGGEEAVGGFPKSRREVRGREAPRPPRLCLCEPSRCSDAPLILLGGGGDAAWPGAGTRWVWSRAFHGWAGPGERGMGPLLRLPAPPAPAVSRVEPVLSSSGNNPPAPRPTEGPGTCVPPSPCRRHLPGSRDPHQDPGPGPRGCLCETRSQLQAQPLRPPWSRGGTRCDRVRAPRLPPRERTGATGHSEELALSSVGAMGLCLSGTM